MVKQANNYRRDMSAQVQHKSTVRSAQRQPVGQIQWPTGCVQLYTHHTRVLPLNTLVAKHLSEKRAQNFLQRIMFVAQLETKMYTRCTASAHRGKHPGQCDLKHMY